MAAGRLWLDLSKSYLFPLQDRDARGWISASFMISTCLSAVAEKVGGSSRTTCIEFLTEFNAADRERTRT